MRKLFLASLVFMLTACSAASTGNAVAASVCASRTETTTQSIAMPMRIADTPSGGDEPVLRVVTLNIHSGMGDWKALWSPRSRVQRRLDEMADAIAAAATAPIDVIALNEVDFSSRRSGNIDQARYLADALTQRTSARYDVVHGPTRRRLFPSFDGAYGNAVLVRHPVVNSRSCLFDDTRACGADDAPAGMPSLRAASGLIQRLFREGRGFIQLTIDFHDRPIDIIVTHLDAVATPEREAQASHLLRRFVDPARTTVVLGDMNAVPYAMTQTRRLAGNDHTHDILTSGSLADARVMHNMRIGQSDFRAWATFPAAIPLWPLDTVLGTLDLIPDDARVMDVLDTDHRGLYVAYRITRDGALIGAQRLQHDTVRRRQLAAILECDRSRPPSAMLQWLTNGTEFFGRPSVEMSSHPRTVSAL